MLYTDSFVFVHMPKTGGTFVTHSIFEIYGADYPSFLHWNSRFRWHARFHRGVLARSKKYGGLIHGKRKHSGRAEIDDGHREKPVLGIVRNPFDWFVSGYDFRWWTRPEREAQYRARVDLDREFPSFPDISFAEYLDLTVKAGRDDGLGSLARALIAKYCREPKALLADPTSATPDRLAAEFEDVHFLRNERLSDELHAYLLGSGYEAEDVEFLKEKERVVPDGPGKRKSRDWREYYTPELFEGVRKSEGLFLELFPEYDLPLAVES